jgi:sensor histidine kinase regulating citrate/malate metabolism
MRIWHIFFPSMQYGKHPLAFVYEDDGKGMNENDKERIFENGFGKSTGLGLFLSREILTITYPPKSRVFNGWVLVL